ncbi:MAG: SpoIID/LytB domain-containing protein [Fusobacterium sp.]|uniref:SpoIID/LytB domain-containing protein n=1 Tax=Fusobacterium sp. TaxID=68766 RepID=UPI0026DCA0ED|nr:SpoIID/LytB domain-containing protein [Fusobacterium sp.]MDO4690527.1 SpoIID/LytB domain-containing protein [Fusobacterium sp.]
MKKNIFYVIICCFFLFACSKAPVKPKGKPKNVYIPKGSSETVKKKVDLEYSAFKELGLPLPVNNYGNMIDYLVPVNDNDDSSINFSLFKKFNEKKVLEYYKNLNLRGLGDSSSYWRWKTSIKKAELYSKIETKLAEISKANHRNVFTLENNNWVQKPISKVGKVKNVEVVARGVSGIITHLLITSSNGKYLLTKEYNVRRLLATNNQLLGAKGTTNEYSSKPLVNSVVSLPSAHLALEEENGYINIYGAGYGHGAGMPQYAAYTLSQRGNDYKDILKRYYKDAKLVNVSKILGKNTEIKVGITSSSNGNLDHNKLTVSSSGKLRIFNGDIDISLDENQKVDIANKGGKINISTSKGKNYSTNEPLNFYAKGYYLTLSPVVKGHTSAPKYRGTLTISAVGKALRVINSLDIEKYLLQVVPSEMPRSFGLEALKAQAVAARTYAVSDIQKQKYAQYGFHIKDTVESQVYNNQVENEDATKAIEETESQILIHSDRPIDAKYFSTSAGFTSFANDIW